MLFSVVIPCFREGSYIESLAGEIILWARGLDAVSLQLVLVDDSNSPGLRQLLVKLAGDNPEVSTIVLSRNYGQAAATICGLSKAKGDLIATLDDDTQNAKILLDEMLRSQKNMPDIDIFHFLSANDYKPSLRKFGSQIIHKSQGLLIRKDRSLRFSSIRLMKGFIAKEVQYFNFSRPVVNPILSQISINQTSIFVKTSLKRNVTSTYSAKKLASLALSNFFSFSALPLKLLGLLGVIGAPLALLSGLALFATRLLKPEFGGDGFTTIAILSLGSLTVNLIAFGIVGMHIERIQASVSARSPYSVREIID